MSRAIIALNGFLKKSVMRSDLSADRQVRTSKKHFGQGSQGRGLTPLPALKPFGLQAVTPKEFLKLIGVIK